MQTLFQHYSLQQKPELPLDSFLIYIYIYIQQCPNLSLGLDHCCHAYILTSMGICFRYKP